MEFINLIEEGEGNSGSNLWLYSGLAECHPLFPGDHSLWIVGEPNGYRFSLFGKLILAFCVGGFLGWVVPARNKPVAEDWRGLNAARNSGSGDLQLELGGWLPLSHHRPDQLDGWVFRQPSQRDDEHLVLQSPLGTVSQAVYFIEKLEQSPDATLRRVVLFVVMILGHGGAKMEIRNKCLAR